MKVNLHGPRVTGHWKANNRQPNVAQVRVPFTHSDVLHREHNMPNGGTRQSASTSVIKKRDKRAALVGKNHVAPVAHALAEADLQPPHRLLHGRPAPIACSFEE
jgi:hypothetical protein